MGDSIFQVGSRFSKLVTRYSKMLTRYSKLVPRSSKFSTWYSKFELRCSELQTRYLKFWLGDGFFTLFLKVVTQFSKWFTLCQWLVFHYLIVRSGLLPLVYSHSVSRELDNPWYIYSSLSEEQFKLFTALKIIFYTFGHTTTVQILTIASRKIIFDIQLGGQIFFI